MTLKLYDEALERKLKKIFPNVKSAPPEEALFYSSDSDAKVKLPLITMYRMSNPIDWNSYSFAETNTGFDMSDNDRTLTISVNINYQIDIWGANRTVVDDLFKDLVFYMIRKPYITLDMQGSEHDKMFSLRLIDDQSASDISSFSDNNRLYRYSLTYEVREARLMQHAKKDYIIHEVPVDIDSKVDTDK